MSAVVNGDTVTLPLLATLKVDQRRLLPSQWGVGFADTPTGSVLTRTLKIGRQLRRQPELDCKLRPPWLTVTPSEPRPVRPR